MQLKLEIIKGPEKGREFVLEEATTCVAGRAGDNCFVFSKDDPYISRRHFLLEISPPNVYFKDLDVTNPSRINDRYVAEAKLKTGDIIEIGFTQLRVSFDLEKRLKTIHCPECNTAVSLFADEDQNQLCDSCASRKLQRGRGLSTDDNKSRNLFSCNCGRDVTAQADLDGRASELGRRVSYLCDRCFAEIEKVNNSSIDNFDIIKKLGEGGMGKVYLARHRPTTRIVALKVMNIDNRQLAARFNREMRIMENMSHDNILSYIDKGQDKNSGKPYLAMEYAPGGNLDDLLLKNGKPLNAELATHYIILALRGLEYIHARGVAHRDIKPENILLKKIGNGSLAPKITDFGLAKEFSKAGGSRLTRLGTAMGTMFYMPPEQIKNAAGAKEPADIYSMGVTLYHLLTGKYPFNFPSPLDVQRFLQEHDQAKNPGEALRLLMEMERLQTPQLIVLTEEPIPIKRLDISISNTLALAVDKAIQKDFTRRHQSAADFRIALEKTA